MALKRLPPTCRKAIDRCSQDYIEMQTKQNVQFYLTPDSVLKAQLDVWDARVKKSEENPTFKKCTHRNWRSPKGPSSGRRIPWCPLAWPITRLRQGPTGEEGLTARYENTIRRDRMVRCQRRRRIG
jgi:hypothetical protein